jgi:hypothetical protein
MLEKTTYTVPLEMLSLVDVNELNGKTSINKPTGNFFYDPWIISADYRDTVWHKILQTLDCSNIGEARVIVLDSPNCYTKHADIDDRWHLNIFGDQGYLIDLDTEIMHKTEQDGIWYKMDAGVMHTAISVGEHKRVQLVVRELLERNKLVDPVKVWISLVGNNPRYVFDNTLSPWLNKIHKQKLMSNFEAGSTMVKFDIEKELLAELNKVKPVQFTIGIYE